MKSVLIRDFMRIRGKAAENGGLWCSFRRRSHTPFRAAPGRQVYGHLALARAADKTQHQVFYTKIGDSEVRHGFHDDGFTMTGSHTILHQKLLIQSYTSGVTAKN
jgi:hypothetical protein